MPSMINFDLEKAQRLKRACIRASEMKQEQFTFEGSEYVTNYAKYLLEYFATKWPELK